MDHLNMNYMDWMCGVMVKVKLLETISIGTKGDVVNVEKKGAAHLIKKGFAKYYEETPIKKIPEKKIQPQPTKQKSSQKKEIVQEFPYHKQEPVLNNNEPKWLIIEKKIYAPPINITKQLKENIPYETKTTFRLEEPGQWICKKCGAKTYGEKMPLNCSNEGCKSNYFTQHTKPINTEIWKLPKWEDNDIDYHELYNSINDILKELVIFPETIHYKIIALWIISTWKLECWETVGFPVFRGIPGSGKTRALNIIQELCYRCVPCATATFVAVGRLSHYWNVSLTIDEANSTLNPKTESGSQMLNFVKQSYKRGSKYLLGDKDDIENVFAINNFGFKAFAGEKAFNPALVSRGIDIYMEKSEPTGQKLDYYKEEFDRIRTMLLNYRYKTDKPPDLGEIFELKGRTREVYESIIATAIHIGQETKDIILFAQELEKESEEELQGTVQFEILQYIKNGQENETLDDSPEIMLLKEITDYLGWSDGKDRQKIGYLLKNLGLKTKHTRSGKAISLVDRSNAKRLGYLYRRFGLRKV